MSFHVHAGMFWKAQTEAQKQFTILLLQLQLVKEVDLCLFITYAPGLHC